MKLLQDQVTHTKIMHKKIHHVINGMLIEKIPDQLSNNTATTFKRFNK